MPFKPQGDPPSPLLTPMLCAQLLLTTHSRTLQSRKNSTGFHLRLTVSVSSNTTGVGGQVMPVSLGLRS